MTDKRLCEVCKTDISNTHHRRIRCLSCVGILKAKEYKLDLQKRNKVDSEIKELTKILRQTNKSIVDKIQRMKNPSAYLIRIMMQAEHIGNKINKMSQSYMYTTTRKRKK